MTVIVICFIAYFVNLSVSDDQEHYDFWPARLYRIGSITDKIDTQTRSPRRNKFSPSLKLLWFFVSRRQMFPLVISFLNYVWRFIRTLISDVLRMDCKQRQASGTWFVCCCIANWTAGTAPRAVSLIIRICDNLIKELSAQV